jgi:hypothetical protein
MSGRRQKEQREKELRQQLVAEQQKVAALEKELQLRQQLADAQQQLAAALQLSQTLLLNAAGAATPRGAAIMTPAHLVTPVHFVPSSTDDSGDSSRRRHTSGNLPQRRARDVTDSGGTTSQQSPAARPEITVNSSSSSESSSEDSSESSSDSDSDSGSEDGGESNDSSSEDGGSESSDSSSDSSSGSDSEVVVRATARGNSFDELRRAVADMIVVPPHEHRDKWCLTGDTDRCADLSCTLRQPFAVGARAPKRLAWSLAERLPFWSPEATMKWLLAHRITCEVQCSRKHALTAIAFPGTAVGLKAACTSARPAPAPAADAAQPAAAPRARKANQVAVAVAARAQRMAYRDSCRGSANMFAPFARLNSKANEYLIHERLRALFMIVSHKKTRDIAAECHISNTVVGELRRCVAAALSGCYRRALPDRKSNYLIVDETLVTFHQINVWCMTATSVSVSADNVRTVEWSVWEPVAHRTTETAIAFVSKFVNPGGRVVTDCFRAYTSPNFKKAMRDLGVSTFTVNHSVEFVAPNGACTNAGEGVHMQLKKDSLYSEGRFANIDEAFQAIEASLMMFPRTSRAALSGTAQRNEVDNPILMRSFNSVLRNYPTFDQATKKYVCDEGRVNVLAVVASRMGAAFLQAEHETTAEDDALLLAENQHNFLPQFETMRQVDDAVGLFASQDDDNRPIVVQPSQNLSPAAAKQIKAGTFIAVHKYNRLFPAITLKATMFGRVGAKHRCVSISKVASTRGDAAPPSDADIERNNELAAEIERDLHRRIVFGQITVAPQRPDGMTLPPLDVARDKIDFAWNGNCTRVTTSNAADVFDFLTEGRVPRPSRVYWNKAARVLGPDVSDDIGTLLLARARKLCGPTFRVLGPDDIDFTGAKPVTDKNVRDFLETTIKRTGVVASAGVFRYSAEYASVAAFCARVESKPGQPKTMTLRIAASECRHPDVLDSAVNRILTYLGAAHSARRVVPQYVAVPVATLDCTPMMEAINNLLYLCTDTRGKLHRLGFERMMGVSGGDPNELWPGLFEVIVTARAATPEKRRAAGGNVGAPARPLLRRGLRNPTVSQSDAAEPSDGAPPAPSNAAAAAAARPAFVVPRNPNHRPLPPPQTHFPLRPIDNSGTTCFLISVVHLLSHSPSICAMFAGQRMIGLKETDRLFAVLQAQVIQPAAAGNPVPARDVDALRRVLRAVRDDRAVAENNVAELRVSAAGQHDAVDALNALVPNAANMCGRRRVVDLGQPFRFISLVTVKCLMCEFVWNNAVQNELVLTVPPRDGTLQSLIDHHVTAAEMATTCQLCKRQARDNVSRANFDRFPPELLVRINRVRYNAGFAPLPGQHNGEHQEANVTRIESFTLSRLKDGTIDQIEERATYQLTSFLRHNGVNGAGGHYTAFVKKDNVWYELDDARIERAASEAFALAMASQFGALYRYERTRAAT